MNRVTFFMRYAVVSTFIFFPGVIASNRLYQKYVLNLLDWVPGLTTVNGIFFLN